MNKIKIKILESSMSEGKCKHDVLTCNDCGSIIMMREPKKVNAKRFAALAEKINEMPSTTLDDDIADWEHDNIIK